ncbi:MAG: hypothetical protein KGP35_04495, partial [Bacteroidetes bacterium]|nr:hypothetical protein [Bacteroidota bacterium]
MKKILFVLASCLLTLQLFAQAPQRLSYQAIVRNANNVLVTNAPIRMRISILQGSITGTAVYTELHSTTTNASGVAFIEVGGGTSPVGSFAAINWGQGPYFLRSETDPNNGTNYTIVGTTQLLSVPYALQSNRSDSAARAGNGLPPTSSYGALQLFNCNGVVQYTPCLPRITTATIDSIGMNTAVSGGNISEDGGAPVTARGVVWTTAQNPTVAFKTSNGTGSGAFKSNLSGLAENTSYLVRAYATNSAGTAYGNQISFTTLPPLASLAGLNCAGATNSGSLAAEITASGVTSIIPYTGGNGGTYIAQSFPSSGVTGLTANLAAGTLASGAGTLTLNISGTPSASGTASFALSIGGQSCVLTRAVNFGLSGNTSHNCGAANVHNPTIAYGSMTDQDGNVYKTVQIGNQTWMAENLKTTKFRNGAAISNITDSAQWHNNTTGAYCSYNNNVLNDCPYGKLYNWHAVNSTNQLCPTGWHVPTDIEWTALTNFFPTAELGAGSRMKSAGTQYWLNGNIGATNNSGFSGLPGGNRDAEQSFAGIGLWGIWWTSTQNGSTTALVRFLSANELSASALSAFKSSGYSVRCMKDIDYPPAAIASLSCIHSESGLLISGTAASGVKSTFSYTGGNGGIYAAQTISSTGVTGLTATLAAGILANGSGSLSFNITGTPATTGTASFVVNIGGQSCVLTRTVSASSAVVASLNCAQATNNGTLTAGRAASPTVTSIIPYTGGNGVQYAAQTIPSTGITGLTANLAAGRLANGSGNLTVTITGTPPMGMSGNASFALNIGGQSCTLIRTVTLPAASITALQCSNSFYQGSGFLVSGVPTSGISIGIPYSGGNGGTYGTQSISSTGVTGLTATRTAGTLEVVTGARVADIFYTISGTPSIDGIANFLLSLGGQSCTVSLTVHLPPAAVTSLNCGAATHSGTLTAGTPATGASSIIAYTGGNGGTYAAQTINSTGVTGLTATLTGGLLARGAGTLNLNISGTPTPGMSGNATFTLNFGGQTCTFTRTVSLPAASITTLNCTGATNTGTLTVGNVASGVSISIPYTGGNGGTYAAQTIASTGVTGLIATLAAGTVQSGAGTLTYTITGTPATNGTASFALSIGGQTCT